MSDYIPKILLCGNKEEFYAQIGQTPFKIVGQIEFIGEAEGKAFNFVKEGTFALDGKLTAPLEMPKLLREAADYLVFLNIYEYSVVRVFLYRLGCPERQMCTVGQFKNLPRDGFSDVNADVQFMKYLEIAPFKKLLDVDAHFAKTQLMTKGGNVAAEIDCVFDGELLPIQENIYSRVYKNLAECRLKRYDAAIISEKTPAEFDGEFVALENFADCVIVFTKYKSTLNQYIRATVKNFAKVDVLFAPSGEWLFCYRHKPPEDFAVYVVNHKKLPAEHVQQLPDSYKVIHAGRAIAEDLGFMGDDTGENISWLNPYLNEATALYWMWKNTSHTAIGLAHYRRFFTDSADAAFAYDKILSKEKALAFLQDYDICVAIWYDNMTQFENMSISCTDGLVGFVKTIFQKHLLRAQPDYLDAFEYVMNASVLYHCNMFITRRDILDAYCAWLFSFLIDATREVLRNVPLMQFPDGRKRVMGFFTERMLTVWLIKNRLRVKELAIMNVTDLFTKEELAPPLNI